jgi:hypothetical protein
MLLFTCSTNHVRVQLANRLNVKSPVFYMTSNCAGHKFGHMDIKLFLTEWFINTSITTRWNSTGNGSHIHLLPFLCPFRTIISFPPMPRVTFPSLLLLSFLGFSHPFLLPLALKMFKWGSFHFHTNKNFNQIFQIRNARRTHVIKNLHSTL